VGLDFFVDDWGINAKNRSEFGTSQGQNWQNLLSILYQFFAGECVEDGKWNKYSCHKQQRWNWKSIGTFVE
jgi:hypothetical protein